MDASDSVVTLTEHIDVGSSAKLILGHRGESIRKIRETCNVTVGIVGEVGESQRVKICGKQENVIRAKKMIEDTLASSVIECIDVGSSAKLILGHRGETIRKIRETCNVTVGIVVEVGESQRVELSGKPDNVIRAKKMIEDIMSLASSVSATHQKSHPEICFTKGMHQTGFPIVNRKRIRSKVGMDPTRLSRT
eukprot:505218_1